MEEEAFTGKTFPFIYLFFLIGVCQRIYRVAKKGYKMCYFQSKRYSKFSLQHKSSNVIKITLLISMMTISQILLVENFSISDDQNERNCLVNLNSVCLKGQLTLQQIFFSRHRQKILFQFSLSFFFPFKIRNYEKACFPLAK